MIVPPRPLPLISTCSALTHGRRAMLLCHMRLHLQARLSERPFLQMSLSISLPVSLHIQHLSRSETGSRAGPAHETCF